MKTSTDTNHSEDKIQIVPYDHQWVNMAKEEISTLKSILNYDWVIDIQHIGSTAIPGLPAKPIIDIYVGVRSIEEATAAIKSIEK